MSYLGGIRHNYVANVINENLLFGGSPDMNVDGSTPKSFQAKPASGEIWHIARMFVYFSSSVAFAEDKFANLTALTNGVSLKIDGVEIANWKDNVDVLLSMFDADGKEVYTKKDKSIAGRMSFSRFMEGNKDGITTTDSVNGIELVVQDNLLTLDIFRSCIQGSKRLI